MLKSKLHWFLWKYAGRIRHTCHTCIHSSGYEYLPGKVGAFVKCTKHNARPPAQWCCPDVINDRWKEAADLREHNSRIRKWRLNAKS